MKKIIINADDFGLSENNNIAVKNGYEAGIITSTSLIANLEGFEHAVKKVIPTAPNLDIGFHFNIMEGKSLSACSLLCDSDGYFNNSYLKLIIKSKEKNFINQTEREFRYQLEQALKYCKISHIDSHVHTHAIPEIFNLTVKLAEEYNIPYVRNQREIPYIVPNKIFNMKFPVNIIKNILLNTYSGINIKKLKNSNIKTNDYFIGVLYTGYMDENAILNGINAIKDDNSIIEIIFHPYISTDRTYNYKEYLITQSPDFKQKLANQDCVLTNYSSLLN